MRRLTLFWTITEEAHLPLLACYLDASGVLPYDEGDDIGNMVGNARQSQTS
jgi:hypothetical protein